MEPRAVFDFSDSRDAMEDGWRVGQTSAANARPAASKPPNKVVDVIVIWNSELSCLRDAIDVETGWGPFELMEAMPAFFGTDGDRRVLCRFVYHGAALRTDAQANERKQFEQQLLEGLSIITTVEKQIS